MTAISKVKKIFLFPVVAAIIFYGNFAFANAFSPDTRTIYHELVGPSSFVLVASSTNTIVGVSVQQSGTASESIILCGSNVVATNYARELNFNIINYVCNDSISVSKTGQDSAAYIISYVPYNTNLLASSTPVSVSGFTYGEVLQTTFLLLIFTLLFFLALKDSLVGVRISNLPKNKYNKEL